MDKGEGRRPRKDERAEKAQFGRVSDRDWKDHHELFNHLVAAGPRMHGTPGERRKRGGG